MVPSFDHRSKARILVAEDEPLIARNIERILRDAGYEVVANASSPAEVHAALAGQAVDLVLLDIGFQGAEDGVSLAARIAPPVLFVSGRADDLTLQRVRAVGARGFVVKPFSARQLVAAVELALTPSDTPGTELTDARLALAEIASTLARAGLTEPAATGRLAVQDVPALELLSSREREVLDALLEHHRPPQIAKLLHISPHTVRNHLKSIYAKLEVHSQAELFDMLLTRRRTTPAD